MDWNQYQPGPRPRLHHGTAAAARLGLLIAAVTDGVLITRLAGPARYPRMENSRKLFTVAPGQIARYRANLRTLGSCCCAPYWYYEDWTIWAASGQPRPDIFLTAQPDHDLDHRVHLYGGRQRPSRKLASA